MTKITADETVTVRLPRGAAKKLKAATGQPFSYIIRMIVLEMLAKFEREGRLEAEPKHKVQQDIAAVVNQEDLNG